MKVCIPTETDMGKEAKVYDYFGSAQYFTIYDTEKDDCDTIDNSNKHHVHGTCHPLEVLECKTIDVVVCSSMGKRAIQKLNDVGIRAYKASGADVKEVIDKYWASELEEITLENVCHRHSCR